VLLLLFFRLEIQPGCWLAEEVKAVLVHPLATNPFAAAAVL
jgi:hypothetical protein